MEKLKIGLPVIQVIVFTALMLFVSHQVKLKNFFTVVENNYLNFQFNYQLFLLFLSILSLTITYLLNREHFVHFFKFGNISNPAESLAFFGIKDRDSWLKTGLSLSVFISLATAIFMYFQIKHEFVSFAQLKHGIVWIVLFSLTNSFAEEMIFRMGIVSPLKGLLQPMTIYIISAVLFGIPHLLGMPSGIIGAVMAGVLGLVLAKSLYETNGFFWAWFIHCIQDVIIIGSLYLLSFKQ